MGSEYFIIVTLALCALWIETNAEDKLRQSPIDISRMYATTTFNFPQLQFKNYALPIKKGVRQFSLLNTGHGAQISLHTNKHKPTLQGGPLGRDIYELAQVHFHWGETDGAGSEHQLNSKAYSMEVHLVHFNKKYGEVAEALNYGDGLAVVGFFIEGYRFMQNSDFQHVVDLLPKIPHPGDRVNADTDLLTWIAPYLRPDGYFTYEGSLTTKPYLENVRWLMYDSVVPINRRQIHAFRNLESDDHEFLHTNYRGVQPLNNRKVYYIPEMY